MSENDNDGFDWTALADEFKKNHRPHAGHFSWETNRVLAERGVLEEFTNALAHEAKLFFRAARHRGEGGDPPDCEAEGAGGNQIGIEITELVDGPSIQAARLGKAYDWKDWKGALLPELDRLLRRKDKPREIKGGPYSEYVLVIFSDEPWIERDYVEQSLREHSFDATELITKAFLLLSYDPSVQHCPCYELRLQSSSSPPPPRDDACG